LTIDPPPRWRYERVAIICLVPAIIGGAIAWGIAFTADWLFQKLAGPPAKSQSIEDKPLY
jgi:hypothetical protein